MSKKITAYKLINGNQSEVEKKVNENLKAGFQLFGSPFATGRRLDNNEDSWHPAPETPEIVQAVVFEDQ